MISFEGRLNGWYLGLAAAAVILRDQILEQIGALFKGSPLVRKTYLIDRNEIIARLYYRYIDRQKTNV
jgi:hypothetical protein